MIDCHMHSALSGDTETPFLDMCSAAINKGLTEICFTEHADFDPSDYNFGKFDYDRYKALIEQARELYSDRLSIFCGVEIDYQPKYEPQIRNFLRNKEFDYIIGSAHYVNGILLEEHERYFPGKTADEAYSPYFDNVLAAANADCFDAIAHLDLCKRYGVRYFGRFDWSPYRERIVETLRAAIDENVALEINTSGLRQLPGDTYPCRGILDLYYAMGGRNIVVGSDAHSPNDVGFGITESLRTAAEIGFDHINVYSHRNAGERSIAEVLHRR